MPRNHFLYSLWRSNNPPMGIEEQLKKDIESLLETMGEVEDGIREFKTSLANKYGDEVILNFPKYSLDFENITNTAHNIGLDGSTMLGHKVRIFEKLHHDLLKKREAEKSGQG